MGHRQDLGHCPDDLGGIVVECFRAQADVRSTRDEEGLASRVIASKVRRGSRLKEISLPTSRRGR